MSSAMDDTVKHKSHRDRNAGRKAEKKKIKKEHVQELSDRQRNPKAFTFNSAIRAERRFRRKQDIETKKQHIPLIDRTPLEPPPVLVAVVGPPKVGKSLVIQCLIKSYVKQPLTNILGPVTVVSGKKQRITFIECNNDVNCMIDIAKVADLVLLLVDASFGFEMEIFEFLNICQVHGMPRIMGVLTHLDLIKNVRQMRKIKKTLKHRFWAEVFAGAKLFYLSGLLHEEYLRTEIKNLARFISVMRFRPLTWRTTHPYLLADRLEDLTSPELIRKNSKVDRNICLYGYVRGIPLNKDTSIHIPGCGDMKIKDVNFLPDPCPLPEHIKKRALVEKERLIYAPFSGVGGIVYDKDAVYVELGGSHSYKEEDTGLAGALMDTQETLDQKLQHSELKLFSDAAPIKSQDVNESMARYTGELVTENGRVRRKVIFKDEADVKNVSNKDDDDNLIKHEDEDSEDDENNEDDSNDDNDYNMDENNDDDDEWSDVETLEKTEKGVKRKGTDEGNIQKKKKRDSVNSTIENDVNLDESELTNDKKMETPLENAGMYHSLSKESDKLIKNKISEALSLLEATKKVKQDVDDESFDELSDEDSRAGLEMDDTDRLSDFEDIASEEEDIEEDKEDIKMDESEEVPDELKWKRNLTEKAREAFINRQQSNKNLMKIVYGVFDKINTIEEEEDKEDEKLNRDIGGIFRVIQEQQRQKIQQRELQNQEESVFFSMESPRDWLKEENKALLINRFVTGKWKESEDAEELLKLDDEDLYGDFEDLETGEKHKAEHPEELPADEVEENKKLLEKKKKLKEQFNTEYDNTEKKTYYDDLKDEVERQAGINKSEFDGLDDDIRVQLEGYRPGMYVRVEIEAVPCELITHLDPTYPIIIGGLLHGEENIGYVQTRIKKHRWYSRILKSRDPLIFSIGWRRFQSLPIYSKLEDNLRHRMLKYTPEHVACMSHLWGPITPQGTGVLAVQDVASKEPGFRIVATGSIVELDKSTEVMKKLKLIGVPMKIHRKTAFIKDMFNSALEVAKFEGARIKTVSGIRGQIKKAISKPEGCFRATFEDKIMLSDIVFCRTWYKVDVPRFYNPVTSLLLPPAEKSRWHGMKTTGQLKRERNIHAEANMNSIYTPVERDVKVFKPLFIPRKLQKELPYRDKPKLKSVPHLRKPKFKQGRVAVVREPQEQNIARIIKMIRTNYAKKQKQSKEAMTKRITAYQVQIKEEEAKKLRKQKQEKKEIFRDLSKLEKKKSR
ncbi:PREDICTED: ribosome biogenesis protein BMS1 homolog [Trachymyrmex cornetzi]|uniref:ribosome biogenesis protein BMS1 homolog n=1 Tax=Trachymyrmex cornetzi TaxID=471704 RepID=UPI00084EDA6C|nr:PREDICTED: ribosome biogenesis protein BMS1 homolog [Trachymyrmex cornetzi]XP_018368527.1 PREDICTED: ribosome biogenesis protein BMS1 homolog [Trachymyrmex cornetzi]XP_018368528.1 PREDICTED: ribosome biogenesis protein BMS1 homolog [Trachymyrmex cornetzi]